MGNIMWGIVFLLAGVVLVWLGIRQRKRAQRDYEDDVRRYTASTVMTVVRLDESVLETWEDRDDGGRELRHGQPLHAALEDRIFNSEKLPDPCIHVSIVLSKIAGLVSPFCMQKK